jgi:glycosyltransferase involved in cell wall biosynthesis
MQKVCIVIPCFNEANRLEVNNFRDYLSLNSHVHFCFVNDGSSDNTLQILREQFETKYANATILDLQKNVGKAEAIRTAVNECLQKLQCNYIGYFDADLATPLTEIDYLISHIKTKENFKVAIGARTAHGCKY